METFKMERKLVSVKRIHDIQPIEDADKIELVFIDGWQCVSNKENGFKIGDLVLYCEIDTVLPEHPETEFLRNKNFRIKTIRLRGKLSQGLIFPISVIQKIVPDFTDEHLALLNVGHDVTELIGATKWEAPIPACLGGQIEGYFPNKVPKTDAERCLSENCLIETEDGIKTIKEICETQYNGKIKSYDFINDTFCWETIMDYHILRNNNDWYEIELENGYKIQLTETHPVYLKNLMCFRRVNELVVGDVLFTKN